MQTDALARALDAVHAAILAGRIDDLGDLTDTITRHATHLDAASEASLRDIRGKAARNALCLQAAIKGVRAAQRRLAELRGAGAGHVTYNQNGQRSRVGGADGTLRQRI